LKLVFPQDFSLI